MKSQARHTGRVGWLGRRGLRQELSVWGSRFVSAGWLWLVLGGLAAPAAAPKLVSSSPANAATGVDVGSPVVFVFDVAMLPIDALNDIPGLATGALKWSSNVTPDNFTYTWSDDGKTLTCTYGEDLPAQAQITWQLNPPGVFPALQFQSASGTPLPGSTYSGGFTTGAASGGGGGGGGGGGAPVLVSSSPASGAKDVAVASTIQFVFDQPMTPNPVLGGFPPFIKGAISWSGTGLDATKFTYAWSNGDKTLTCTYAGSLPGTTLISWEFNPAGTQAELQLQSAENVALANTKGNFTTGAGSGGGGGGGGGGDNCDPNPVPDDWGGYTLGFTHQYVQTSAAGPVPQTDNPFGFAAFLRGPSSGPAITAGSLTVPGKAAADLEGFFGNYFLSGEYDTEAALDAAYPAGAYTLKFTQTGQPERVINMSVPAAKPTVPTIANFAETQSVNASADFVLRWNAFTGAVAPTDMLSVTISDGTNLVFQAPDFCLPRELAVTATSVVIPANTLKTDKQYELNLNFMRTFHQSTNAIPQMAGFGTISRTTSSTIRTGTGGNIPGDPARFTAFRLLPNGNPELTIQGSANKTYTVQRTSSLLNAVWSAAGTVTMSAAGTVVFEDRQTAGARPLFYRAVAN